VHSMNLQVSGFASSPRAARGPVGETVTTAPRSIRYSSQAFAAKLAAAHRVSLDAWARRRILTRIPSSERIEASR
jgi:hypothetical protein